MVANTCPDCGTELSPSNSTIDDGGEDFTTYDAYHFLAGGEEDMKNVTVHCDDCGWQDTRTVSVS